jgi:hypothetical protein
VRATGKYTDHPREGRGRNRDRDQPPPLPDCPADWPAASSRGPRRVDVAECSRATPVRDHASRMRSRTKPGPNSLVALPAAFSARVRCAVSFADRLLGRVRHPPAPASGEEVAQVRPTTQHAEVGARGAIGDSPENGGSAPLPPGQQPPPEIGTLTGPAKPAPTQRATDRLRIRTVSARSRRGSSTT